MTDTVVDFTAGVPVRGDLNVRWIHGSPPGRRVGEPKFQVHACDPHTYLLRQSKTVSFEAPFLYLLFGNERALLLDTGARTRPSASPLRATIDKLIARWLHEHPRQGYQLVVAHTHGHNDHVAGQPTFCPCTPARRPTDPATRCGPTVAGAGHCRMPTGPMPSTNRARS
jgi:glyoxylase-like metal-dependent hydrolase (beta-lactamase superfamily II)